MLITDQPGDVLLAVHRITSNDRPRRIDGFQQLRDGHDFDFVALLIYLPQGDRHLIPARPHAHPVQRSTFISLFPCDLGLVSPSAIYDQYLFIPLSQIHQSLDKEWRVITAA